jgi:hypothetical protein
MLCGGLPLCTGAKLQQFSKLLVLVLHFSRLFFYTRARFTGILRCTGALFRMLYADRHENRWFLKLLKSLRDFYRLVSGGNKSSVKILERISEVVVGWKQNIVESTIADHVPHHNFPPYMLRRYTRTLKLCRDQVNIYIMGLSTPLRLNWSARVNISKLDVMPKPHLEIKQPLYYKLLPCIQTFHTFSNSSMASIYLLIECFSAVLLFLLVCLTHSLSACPGSPGKFLSDSV